MFADEMQVQGMGDQIAARGNVRTILYNTSSTEQRKAPMQTRSDTLAAHKLERRIDLSDRNVRHDLAGPVVPVIVIGEINDGMQPAL